MNQNLLTVLSLVFVVSMLTMLSKRWKISYPVLFVVAGLIISFIPGLPPIRLHSSIVFLIFLPPLLFFAAWNTSWKGFWAERRRIGMLAFGLVIITSTVVAGLCHMIIPQCSLASGFLLGAIISPPDAVAASSIMQGQKISKKVVVILEGESLINDAASLIVFRFALAAILVGGFSMEKATKEFFLVTAGGILVGLSVALIVYLIHRFLPTTADIDTTMTLLAPYIIYVTAEHFEFSGVMAVVSGGLFLSARSHEVFQFDSRLQVAAVWKTINFLLNGFVFILIGLQLNTVMHALKIFTLTQALLYSLIISLVTILIRITWILPVSYFRFRLSKKKHPGEVFPLRSTFIVAWCGMRGVVSLASALSLPLLLPSGEIFPLRNLTLFVTFAVIFMTLVVQGSILPLVIRILRVPGDRIENIRKMEYIIHARLANSVLEYLNRTDASHIVENEWVARLKIRYESILHLASHELESVDGVLTPNIISAEYHQLLIELVTIRRRELLKLRRESFIQDELINTREMELDLEEARLQTSF